MNLYIPDKFTKSQQLNLRGFNAVLVLYETPFRKMFDISIQVD